ncbi:Spore morphogenesis and germination protein YwcE [Bacillus velezensis]
MGFLLLLRNQQPIPLGHTLMIILFAANVIVAHIAAFIIYGLPRLRRRRSQ